MNVIFFFVNLMELLFSGFRFFIMFFVVVLFVFIFLIFFKFWVVVRISILVRGVVGLYFGEFWFGRDVIDEFYSFVDIKVLIY